MGACNSKTATAGAAAPSEAPKKQHVAVGSTDSTSYLSDHHEQLRSAPANEKENHATKKKESKTEPRSDESKPAENEPSKPGSLSSHRRPSVAKIKRGYSSGESSDSSLVNEQEEKNRGRVNSYDDLVLCGVRSELSSDCELRSKVVRIETPFGKPIEEIYDGVHDGPVLGSGVSGVVRLVTHRSTGVKYAVKCLDLGLLRSAPALKQLRDEISIMCQLDHPNIVRLEEVYEGENEIYLVQELCLGGDLFDRLDDQPDFHYTEAQCARLVKQMLSSVRYLHSKNIIHRDLKLENFLFSSESPTSELKMIDFGLSKHFTFFGEVHHEAVGTPYTVAPEIIKGSYDEKSDIWALGVITYLLFSGETPFGGCDGENLLNVRDNILRGSVVFEPEDVWQHVSDLGKNFVRRVLDSDPSKRPTAKELQKDQWLQVWAKKDAKEGSKLNPKIVESLVGFKEYSDMKKLLYEVLSFTLLPEQIHELREEFAKMDTEGTGEISLKALKQVLMENAEAGALGALTEEEVEDIFNSLRVRKSEATIQWHEFIAAGLSQCKVDDRNLRLAFDRLDTDRKGYVTFSDINDLLGNFSESEESLKQMWFDGISEDRKTEKEQITFSDFLILMKGQTKERQGSARERRRSIGEDNLSLDGGLEPVPENRVSPQPAKIVHRVMPLKTASGRMAPAMLSMPSLTDPTENPNVAFPGDLSPEVFKFGRFRSKSMETKRESYIEEDEEPTLASNVGRAVVLPSKANSKFEKVIEDTSKTPLSVNRALYRKHREMRLAVMEASKKFDEKRRERLVINMAPSPPVPEKRITKRASLIMRRGSVREEEQKAEKQAAVAHEQMVDAAARKCGRPRRARKKTVSDMTGMMSA